MQNQDIIIITLTILAVYYAYQQNQVRPNTQLDNQENQTQIKELQQEVQHYQTLYQKRVEKDLVGNQEKTIQEFQTKLAKQEEEYQEQTQLITDYKQLETNLRTRISNLEGSLEEKEAQKELYSKK